jgi:hypothetical protein
MVKSITIFRSVGDVQALLKFYVEVALPTIHALPGVICTDITSVVSPVSADVAQDLDGIQVIMETHFESVEAMNKLLFSADTQKLMQMAGEVTPCELTILLGNEKRFSGEMTDHLQRTIARIGYDNHE